MNTQKFQVNEETYKVERSCPSGKGRFLRVVNENNPQEAYLFQICRNNGKISTITKFTTVGSIDEKIPEIADGLFKFLSNSN